MTQQRTDLTKAVRTTETARGVGRILREWYAKTRRAGSEGRPVAWCMLGPPPEIIAAFDVSASFPENYGTACAARQKCAYYCEIAEREGFSPDLCSYERNSIGYINEFMEHGDIPPDSPHQRPGCQGAGRG